MSREFDENVQEEILNTLEYCLESFLTFLESKKVLSLQERQIMEKLPSSRRQAQDLLKILQKKRNGRAFLIGYLRNNKYESLADKIQNVPEAREISRPESPLVPPSFFISKFKHVIFMAIIVIGIIPAACFFTQRTDNMSSIQLVFKSNLSSYYKTEYCRVPMVHGHHITIPKVWVSLPIFEKTENFMSQNPFDHIELVRRLREPQSPHVALIKGHPGVGKTTLVKKIAYDWATDKDHQFALVLVVPLRYVGPTTEFLQSAVDYYKNLFGLSLQEKTVVLDWLKQLGPDLLICLDGLDEYNNLTESPFRTLFKRSVKTAIRSPPPSFPYQLLITSRPYACDIVARDFFPLRFEISPLDESHLASFVSRYCKTDDGVKKVSKYLKSNTKWVIKVPLILTFVCYLADVREEIPNNLSLLYEKILEHMVKREIEQKKLTEEINFEHWTESETVKSTAKLAFEGCKAQEFKFSQSIQRELNVTGDGFTCGFLLHKFDFGQERQEAEFLHRSVQEFFAAFHAYQLISYGDEKSRNTVMKEILNSNSQFGRFFFGISSERKFDEMLDWLNPTLADARIICFSFGYFFNALSAGLSDSSKGELVGRRLAKTINQLENEITQNRDEKISVNGIADLSLINKPFQTGLNMNSLDGSRHSWFISHSANTKWSKLTYIFSWVRGLYNLREKFDEIQILVWKWDIALLPGLISSLEMPPISTLIIHILYTVDFEVNFNINYKLATTATTSSITRLRHFTFGFGKSQVAKLKEKFSSHVGMADLVVDELRKTGHQEDIRWVTIKVRLFFDQQHLVKSLICLALEIYDSP